MNKMQKQVMEFQKKFEMHMESYPNVPPNYVLELRKKLIAEEAQEFCDAVDEGDFVKMVDALGDLLYVTFGAGCSFGVDLEPILDEVHRSNMTKVWPDGTVHKNEYGKVVKPSTYSPAKIASVLVTQSRVIK